MHLRLTSTNSRWTFWPTSVSVDAEWSSSSFEMSNFGCLRILTCEGFNNSRRQRNAGDGQGEGKRGSTDLADVAVLEGVDALRRLLDLTADNLRDELLNELLEVARGGLTLRDLEHLLADLTDLRRLSVGRLLDLVRALLGEADGEEADEVTVGGLDVDVRLDQGLPLADERAELVRGEVHAVEVGQARLALDLVDTERDLAERVLVVLVEVSQGQLKDAALERVVGVLCRRGVQVSRMLSSTDSCGRRRREEVTYSGPTNG